MDMRVPHHIGASLSSLYNSAHISPVTFLGCPCYGSQVTQRQTSAKRDSRALVIQYQTSVTWCLGNQTTQQPLAVTRDAISYSSAMLNLMKSNLFSHSFLAAQRAQGKRTVVLIVTLFKSNACWSSISSSISIRSSQFAVCFFTNTTTVAHSIRQTNVAFACSCKKSRSISH